MKSTFHTLSRYDHKTIHLHWITAGLVIALWCLGQSIDWFPRGMPRIVARSTHISVGALLAMVLCYRMYWRSTEGVRLPALGSRRLDQLGHLVHFLLYVSLVGVIVLGITNAWVQGDTLFNLFKIPALDAGNKALRRQVEELHAISAHLLLILASLHAIAGLFHHYILKDGILGRMLPGLERL